jgi:hypothetical protein
MDPPVRRWIFVLLVAGCGGQPGAGEDCPAPPYFTVLPVDESAIAFVTVIGGFSPPAHTLPSDHGGVYLTGQGIPLRAPGAGTLTSIRRTRYLASPFRTGAQDFALDLSICGAVRVSLGHIVSLPDALEALIQPGGCQQYSTANETVEACYTRVSRPVAAGDPLGIVGGPTAGAFDFGVYDTRHHNAFANPQRYSGQMAAALCPYTLFAEGPRAVLLAHVGSGAQRRVGDPPCGTMEVDQPGTAQGMWVREDLARTAMAGDESPYLTLTHDVVRPADKLFFAVGVPQLGAGAYTAPRPAAGAYPPDFSELRADGSVACYEVQPGQFRPPPAPRISFRLSLSAEGRLSVEKREDATACDDPQDRTIGPGALTFVR